MNGCECMVIINTTFVVCLGGLGTVRQCPTGSYDCINENENVSGNSKQGWIPPRVKALVFLVIHMCLTVKAHESVGRLVKHTVRP